MSKLNLVRITVDAVFGQVPLFVPRVYRGAEAVAGTLRFKHESGRPLMLEEDRLMQPTAYCKARHPSGGVGVFGIIWATSDKEDEAKVILADAIIKATNDLVSEIGTTLTALRPVQHINKLWGDRHEEADMEFESFSFPAEVVASSGWDYTVPGNEMTKTVFLEAPEGEESIAAKFVVTFDEGKADVLTADGYIKGEIIEQLDLSPKV